MPRSRSVGQFLVEHLEQTGLGHVFGIPGDYVLGFYDLLVDSRMEIIGTCTEIGAGYAADAYARVSGLGAVCVTYCVGGLNVLNAVAGAYAEKSPLIVISGAPGLAERHRSPLLHHQVRDFHTQFEIYEKVTCAACVLDDPPTAARRIVQVIEACRRVKRPVYIEVPRDMVDEPCVPAVEANESMPRETPDPAVRREAVAEASQMLRAAKRPVIVAGVEVHRFGLQEKLLRLVERTGYPVVATLLGKSVIRENHPQYLGVYEGAMGHEQVRRAVEGADCVLFLGAFMSDINLGVYTARLDPDRCIDASSQRISIRRHYYEHVELGKFIEALSRSLPARRGKARTAKAQARSFKARPNRPVTVRRLFDRMNELLDERTVVICDIGDSLFGAIELTMHRRTEFLSPAYYTSMGFAVPAAIGAQMAQPNLRPIVFVGDGAFQMTGHELACIARYGLNPIIIVLNNKGYTTERMIHEGPYNDIHDCAYHLWPQVVRKGWGCEVTTEGELEEALATALTHTNAFSIINLHLDPSDHSKALERLGRRLSKRAGLAK
ncbi:MAG: preprotein translocase subunit Tim44 [Phycisphaeraceae bacterium]|nr:preprotein translocase subunit Tim44 [Phycisphaeraceae bacterium]